MLHSEVPPLRASRALGAATATAARAATERRVAKRMYMLLAVELLNRFVGEAIGFCFADGELFCD